MNRINDILNIIRRVCKDYYIRITKTRVRIGVKAHLSGEILDRLRMMGANIVCALYRRGTTYFSLKIN